ncbi:hypothetical protein AAG570_009937 [Ranatra chinensis]|uniref:Uncharacterized protein n=1 Tax=Ranatra chinensis TaxID=642074 RepID=A0ABD0ZBR0_9HEMI
MASKRRNMFQKNRRRRRRKMAASSTAYRVRTSRRKQDGQLEEGALRRHSPLNVKKKKKAKLSTESKLTLYNATLKPTWAYGVELWESAKKSDLDRIQAFQSNGSVRALLRVDSGYISDVTFMIRPIVIFDPLSSALVWVHPIQDRKMNELTFQCLKGVEGSWHGEAVTRGGAGTHAASHDRSLANRLTCVAKKGRVNEVFERPCGLLDLRLLDADLAGDILSATQRRRGYSSL